MILLSKLTPGTANINSLLQLHLVYCILCIRDCTSNPSNCGQVGDKPMIVDFRIKSQSSGYANSDVLDNFYKGGSEYIDGSLMQWAMKASIDVKKDILKKSLQEWNSGI